jgi:hypothetical protein
VRWIDLPTLYEEAIQISLRGNYHFIDGRKFEGEFVNEKMTGYGKFSWPNGDRYEGNFQNDQKNAYGTYFLVILLMTKSMVKEVLDGQMEFVMKEYLQMIEGTYITVYIFVIRELMVKVCWNIHMVIGTKELWKMIKNMEMELFIFPMDDITTLFGLIIELIRAILLLGRMVLDTKEISSMITLMDMEMRIFLMEEYM